MSQPVFLVFNWHNIFAIMDFASKFAFYFIKEGISSKNFALSGYRFLNQFFNVSAHFDKTKLLCSMSQWTLFVCNMRQLLNFVHHRNVAQLRRAKEREPSSMVFCPIYSYVPQPWGWFFCAVAWSHKTFFLNCHSDWRTTGAASSWFSEDTYNLKSSL